MAGFLEDILKPDKIKISDKYLSDFLNLANKKTGDLTDRMNKLSNAIGTAFKAGRFQQAQKLSKELADIKKWQKLQKQFQDIQAEIDKTSEKYEDNSVSVKKNIAISLAQIKDLKEEQARLNKVIESGATKTNKKNKAVKDLRLATEQLSQVEKELNGQRELEQEYLNGNKTTLENLHKKMATLRDDVAVTSVEMKRNENQYTATGRALNFLQKEMSSRLVKWAEWGTVVAEVTGVFKDYQSVANKTNKILIDMGTPLKDLHTEFMGFDTTTLSLMKHAWDTQNALHNLDVTAVKLGYSAEAGRETFLQYQEELRGLGKTHAEIMAKTVDLTDTTLKLSKILGIDVSEAAGFATENFNKFGTSAEVSLDALGSMRTEVETLNKGLNPGMNINMKDATRLVMKLASETDNYTFNARLLSKEILQQEAYYLKLGFSREQAAKKATEAVKSELGENATEFQKYQVGQKMFSKLKGKSDDQMVVQLKQMGVSDSAKQHRIIELMHSNIANLDKFPAIFQEFSGTQAESLENFNTIFKYRVNPRMITSQLGTPIKEATDQSLKAQKALEVYSKSTGIKQGDIVKNWSQHAEKIHKLWQADISQFIGSGEITTESAKKFTEAALAPVKETTGEAKEAIKTNAQIINDMTTAAGNTISGLWHDITNSPIAKMAIAAGSVAAYAASSAMQIMYLRQIAANTAGGGPGKGMMDKISETVGGKSKFGQMAAKYGKVGGAVGGAVYGGIEAYNTFTDEKATKHDKVGAVAGIGGAAAGGYAGAALGTLLLPGIGTIVGGAVGAWLGQKGSAYLGKKASEAVWKSPAANAVLPSTSPSIVSPGSATAAGAAAAAAATTVGPTVTADALRIDASGNAMLQINNFMDLVSWAKSKQVANGTK